MARTKALFVCRECGGVQTQWMGKCPDCGAWDSLEQQSADTGAETDTHKGLASDWGLAPEQAPPKARPLTELEDEPPARRIHTGMGELDRALGGGVVPGSAILFGGDPGIGKSTLLLQAAGRMARSGARTLYVTSEESARQIRLRAERLGVTQPEQNSTVRDHESRPARADSVIEAKETLGADELFVLADTNLARIVEQARKVRPAVLVVDSIQMIYRSDIEASPGSIAQLRRCCTDLVYLAKTADMAVALVGHVTKEGALAGPRLLEHLVDAVMYFEGDRYHAHRVLRSVKNRFGTTLEIGLFEMGEGGLRELPEGASVAAGSFGDEARPGSVVAPVLTGTRCVLVELQSLTATGFLGSAKRKTSGIDQNRLAMIIAVLEQHAGLRLADRDVFTSAVGGLRVIEPAADLAIALAVCGAHYRKALPPATCALGEVGLGGEIRPVTQIEMRVREAGRLGYRHVLLPKDVETPEVRGVKQMPVATISQAIDLLE